MWMKMLSEERMYWQVHTLFEKILRVSFRFLFTRPHQLLLNFLSCLNKCCCCCCCCFKISGLFMDPSIGEIRIYYKVTRIIVIDKKVNQNSRLWIKEVLLTTRKKTNKWVKVCDQRTTGFVNKANFGNWNHTLDSHELSRNKKISSKIAFGAV